MTPGRQVLIGQRYRAVRPDGTPSLVVWEVVEVYRAAPGGIEHARLRKIGDRTETRTFATAIITNRARFAPEN